MSAGMTIGCASAPKKSNRLLTSKDVPPLRAISHKVKFGFSSAKELDGLTMTIESLETEQKNLYQPWVIPASIKMINRKFSLSRNGLKQ